MDNEKLKEILERHRKWLNDEDGGERANLYEANLYGANLREADLREADLREADLYGANLREANLYGANLYGANLYGANLREANLREANLYGANLYGANLREAKNIPFIPLVCPERGSFTAFKKCGSYIIELLIPQDAKRCSATTRKCRASYAKVVAITNMDGSQAEVDHVTNHAYEPIEYKIGEYVHPDSFDDDRWNECSHGIHFFINRQEAVEY
ncbi:MAG TPA: pentapeptide repeat-containing protein [Oscillospiraceae bacterium]|nr:pentapeptide repeat-containing protein [Oscillospiraceae bacterium]